MESLTIIYIHPLNNTYPVATIQFGKSIINYSMFYDHDIYNGNMKSLQILDNTCYPQTLDPIKQYTENDPIHNYEVLGLKDQNDNQLMMEFDFLIFHYPLEKTCPLQCHQFDKKINLKFNSIKLNYMQEYMYRINDYFFYQFLYAISDSNPYQRIIDEYLQNEGRWSAIKDSRNSAFSFKNSETNLREEEKKENTPDKTPQFLDVNYYERLQNLNLNKDQSSFFGFNDEFDLQQYPLCSGLNIVFDQPLIILKDRPYLPGKLEINLGEITITNFTREVAGRWKSNPSKTVQTNTMVIDFKKMGIHYDLIDFQMAPSFNLTINFEKLNYTPLLEDQYLSKGIDFLDLDISYKITMNFSALQLRFRQEVYEYFMRCMDLNINYVDNMAEHFQLYFLYEGVQDNQKYLKIEKETISKFRNKEVFKMKINMQYPSFSFQVINYDNSFTSELVLWNTEIDFQRYIDYRKLITLKSHTIFVLHSAKEFQNLTKQVVIGPIISKKFINTDSDFYNFEVTNCKGESSPLKKQKTLSKLNKKNFQVTMHFEADGDKLVQMKIEKLKIFIKPHIFLMIYEMFVYGLPTYSDDSKDKPNFYDSDYGNAPRLEFGCSILQSLLCFENTESQIKTIACQGNVSFTFIREKLNQIKQRLLEIPILQDEQNKSMEMDQASVKSRTSSDKFFTLDYSASTKIMQVSIQDLCPFFCNSSELEGKNFKQVKKREMISPFTFFYNKQDIIELTKINDRLYASSPDRYVFKTYSKIEANLERTLLKISFNDLEILKGIMDQLGKMLNEDYMTIVKDSSHPVEVETRQTRLKKNISDEEEKVALPIFLYTISEGQEGQILKEEEETMKRQSSDEDNTLHSQKKIKNNILKKDNFSDSLRRASLAFSRIQRRYTKKHSELNIVAITPEDSAVSSPDMRRESKEMERIFEECDLEDVDEGSVEIQTLELKRKGSGNVASKRLMMKRDSEGFRELQGFSLVKQERGVDQFQVVSHGLRILVINDNLYNFFPVLGISISEFHYSSDSNEMQRAGMTQFSSAINYYNPEAGEWEPFIETFKLQFTLIEEIQNSKRIFQCECPTQLAFNITGQLVRNLADTYKSWQMVEEQSGLGEQNLHKTARMKFEEDMDSMLLSDKGGTKHAKSGQFGAVNKYIIEDIDEEEELDTNLREEDIVTPYSICNKTNVKLLVKRLTNMEDSSYDKKSSLRFHKSASKSSSSLAVKGGVGSRQSKLNRVYVINPGEQIDYAVDYELQVKQQVSLYNSHQFSGQQSEFVKILFDDYSPVYGANSHTGMNIPLSSVNLNQIGCKKHYVKDDDRHKNSEFYVYGVSLVNMKKVLTIRTQYLFINKTLFTYEVHIRFKNSSIMKTLSPGDSMPIHDSIDSCKFQIRIASEQRHFESMVESTPSVVRNKESLITEEQDESVLLEEQVRRRGDCANLQQISKNWSDLIVIGILKQKLPINRATFLKHGKTYTIIKKELSEFTDAYDITFRPPLILKNCLPFKLNISYIDSNGEKDQLELQKEEEKHIFVFNLQEPIKILAQFCEFMDTEIVIDCSESKENDFKYIVTDRHHRNLELYVMTSTKIAGKKAIFYVKNCVIDYTQQDLIFFYSKPSDKQLRQKSTKDMVAGMNSMNSYQSQAKIYMLSNQMELHAAIEGSHSVSNPINIFNPGCKDKFQLTKDDFLYEYGYSTEIFLATKDDYVYTKITTISPLYVFINQTNKILIVVQEQAKDIPFVIRKGDRVPFYWANKWLDQKVCIKSANEGLSPIKKEQKEFDYSCGFSISELGNLTIQNREIVKERVYGSLGEMYEERPEIRFFRIERKLHNNTIFIIVEEEDSNYPTYMIENQSSKFALMYQQVGEKLHLDLININESLPFTWENYSGTHIVQFKFIYGNLKSKCREIEGVSEKLALDQLNFQQDLLIEMSGNQYEILHVSIYTNGYTKIIRFSDRQDHAQGKNIMESEEEEDCKSMSIYEVFLSQLLVSVVSQQRELLTIYFQKIQARVVDSDKDTKCEFEIGYMQIDNQSEIEPIYPVMVKPKYLKPLFDEQEEEQQKIPIKPMNNQLSVFQLCLDFRKNIPNVIYFELIDYLLQTLEVKLEFSHIILISKFVSEIGGLLNKNLTYMHQIFELEHIEEIDVDNHEDDFFQMIQKQRQEKLGGLKNASEQIMYKAEEEVKIDLKMHKHQPVLRKGLSSEYVVDKMRARTITSNFAITRKFSDKNSVMLRTTSGSQKEFYRRLYSMELGLTHTQTMVQRTTWRSQEFSKKTSQIYIKEYKSTPFEFEVSIINKATFEPEDQDILITISSLGLVLTQIEDAPLKLNALQLNNVFGNIDDVVGQLKRHHTERLKWNILKLIGASNLLGNPMNFVNSLGTGVQDFFYQPKKGFVKGPIQGGIGIIKGTSSLVKNTVIGTIGSASKMVSSFSKGLLVLSNDREYIYKRDIDNIKKKPKNVMQGMKQGVKSALQSVGSGLSGVITKPIEETKRGGVFGFLKGTAQGVTGLFVKPVSGALDFLSLTTEGIRNTAKNDEEFIGDKRLRMPRPFYEKERIIREYDEFHAFWSNIIPKIRIDIDCSSFYEACLVESSDVSWSVFFLTLTQLAMISAQQTPTQSTQIIVKWVYETQSIKYVEIIDGTSLTIGFNDKNLNIDFGDNLVAERIRRKIDKIIKLFK